VRDHGVLSLVELAWAAHRTKGLSPAFCSGRSAWLAGQTVVIVGAGPVGLRTALECLLCGAEVERGLGRTGALHRRSSTSCHAVPE
jgi:hypothetical protein